MKKMQQHNNVLLKLKSSTTPRSSNVKQLGTVTIKSKRKDNNTPNNRSSNGNHPDNNFVVTIVVVDLYQ